MKQPSDLFAGYIPVIDNGYLRSIDRHTRKGSQIGVFATDIALTFAPYTRKEIRLLEPERVQHILTSMGADAYVLSLQQAYDKLADSTLAVTLIDDDISRGLVASTESRATLSFESPFLRWNRQNATVDQSVNTQAIVSSHELDTLFRDLYDDAKKSSDWWRHVSAAVMDSEGALLSIHHNTAMPLEYSGLLESDPRILANRGSGVELSLYLHAEAGCISHAAKEGQSLAGGSIYVTTFPCPNCAKLIAASGIKQVYFTEGYAMLDGQRVLEAKDVEIIKVDTHEQPNAQPHRLIPYPEK